ncbi:hypothetical protein HV168_22265 [Escherichia coli]|nr:hypothetical protein HV168_22265 [Escherichia coli]HAO2706831.1 hypothetical protein [Escherichia coli]HDD9445208.1 hypothetical protein [Escherichia coli]
MESNIKGLVAAGHEMASELKAECGAVDMRSVAKLISDLATQLEVQLVRANALAAENVALRSKAEELANEASKIYSAYNATITEPDGDFIDMQTLHEMQCIETPATDAFLAEVRAQGVEMFAECAYTLEHHDHAVAFAAQLRKGGNQ